MCRRCPDRLHDDVRALRSKERRAPGALGSDPGSGREIREPTTVARDERVTTVPPREGSDESCCTYRAVNWLAWLPGVPMMVAVSFGVSALRTAGSTFDTSTVSVRPSSVLNVSVLPCTPTTLP